MVDRQMQAANFTQQQPPTTIYIDKKHKTPNGPLFHQPTAATHTPQRQPDPGLAKTPGAGPNLRAGPIDAPQSDPPESHRTPQTKQQQRRAIQKQDQITPQLVVLLLLWL